MLIYGPLSLDEENSILVSPGFKRRQSCFCQQFLDRPFGQVGKVYRRNERFITKSAAKVCRLVSEILDAYSRFVLGFV